MKQQSTMLTEFYKAYLAWIESGAPDRSPFSRATGLCANLERFCGSKGLRYPEIALLLVEQGGLFKKAGLSEDYPFDNNDNPEDLPFYTYEIASDKREHHLNEARLNWVKSHI